MSISARDLYFVLRVRDEASSVLSGVSRDILKIGAAAQASSARAQAAALRQQAAVVKASGAARAEAASSAAAATREQAARLRAAGATRDQVTALDQQARAYSREAASINSATTKEVDALKKQAAGYELNAKSLEQEVEGHQKLSKTLQDVSSATTLAGLAFAGLGAAGAAALLSTVKAGEEYDRQVALTQTQTDGFKASLQDLGQIGKDVGSQIAVPFKQLQGALYDIFSSTSANMTQAKTLLENFSKAAVAGQVSIDDSARSTMGIMNAFKIPFQDVSMVLDKQFQLVRKGVGTYGEFADVIGKMTPSAVRLGQNLDTMDATLVFLTRNGLSAASAVAAGARAFDALANPATTKKLDELGIKSRDATGKFLPLVDILKNMKTYLLALPPPDRAEALFNIFKGSGGTIQAKRFFDLVLPTAKGAGNLDQFEGFLKDMQNSTGQFGNAYATMSKTVASQTQLLENNFDILKVSVGQALEPTFVKLLGVGAKILGWFNGLAPAMQKSIAKWALVGTVIMLVVGIVLIIMGTLGALAAALAALGLSLGTVAAIVVGVVAAFAALGVAAYAAFKGSSNVRDLFADIGKTFSDVWTKDIQPFVNNLKSAFEKDLEPALRALGDVVSNYVVPVFDSLWNMLSSNFVKAIAGALSAMVTLGKSGFVFISGLIQKYLIPIIKQATTLYMQHQKAINTVISVIATLIKWILIISGAAVFLMLITVIGATILVFGAMIKITVEIVKFFITLVQATKQAITWFGNLGRSIGSAAADFGHAVAGKFTEAVNWLKSLPSRIRGAVGNLGSILINAGESIISGLINGIKNKLGSLGSFLGSVGSFIAAHKGPPEKDLKMLHGAGQLILKGLQNGMESQMPNLQSKLKNMTAKMQSTVEGKVTTAPVAPLAKQGSPGKNVTVNVYTQEIRPQYHSQQLGQLLAGTL